MPDRYSDEPGPDELWSAEQRFAHRIAMCGLCDDDGYRGVTVCDHIDHTAAAERGMAKVRAALGIKTESER